MKITTAKTYISAMAVAAIVLSGGVLYTINVTDQQKTASAYTSAVNAQEPTTAPDSYNIVFTDINLKHALNRALANVLNTPGRSLDSNISVGEAKQVTDLQKERTLNNSNITNLEGLQYFLNLNLADIKGNQITSLEPIADLPLLEDLRLDENPNITDITPLARLPKLKKLHFGKNKISDFSALATAPALEELEINSAPNLKIDSLKDFTKIKFLNLNGTGLKSDSFGPIKNLPSLHRLTIGGNAVIDLQEMMNGGFANLDGTSGFNNQFYTHPKLSPDQTLFPNPVKTPDGKVVPLIETDKIKNADSDGTLNPNGTHIKLVNFTKDDYGQKRLTTKWETHFNHGAMANQLFSGKVFNIDYDIPADESKPVIVPDKPGKIISRKGQAIVLSDVTAEDNPGGSGLKSFTNDATAKGLDVANPVKGNYTITYTAIDNQDNQSTATREVEITDADALQAKVAATTDDSLKGYTEESVKTVNDKKAAAEAIIGRNDATQTEIDQALNELNQAVASLEVDTYPLQAAVGKYNNSPDYIKNDPAVQQKLADANTALNAPGKTPNSIRQAALDLISALDAAKRAEEQRQADADQAVTDAGGVKTPAQMDAAQAKIDAVKDADKKKELQAKLDAVRNAYDAKKAELKKLIDKANESDLLDGMTLDTANEVKAERKDAKERVYDNNGVSQETIETAIQELQKALDDLRADKKPLADAEATHDTQPEYVKNNPAVAAAFRKAQDTGATANPSVKQVRDDAKALEDAITAAKEAEVEAQQTVETALQTATEKLSAQLAPGEMPDINIQELESALEKVQDPARKAALSTQIDDLKAKVAKRQKQVDDYKKSEAGKRAEAERKAREEADKKAEAERKAKEKAQMDKGGKLSDTGMPVAIPTVGGLGAVLAGIWALIRRRRQ